MTTTKTLQEEARSLRARICRADSRLFPARRQMALRRIQSVLLLAEKNPDYAQSQMAEARFLAEGILQA